MATLILTALTHIRGIILIIPWLLSLVVADTIFTSLLLLAPVAADAVYHISSAIIGFEWKWHQSHFEVVNGAGVAVSGDPIPMDESGIVIANHLCWSDFYMIQNVAIRSNMISRLRYFAKIQLLWVPLMGWGFWALGMPLVSRDWVKDKAEMDRIFHGVPPGGGLEELAAVLVCDGQVVYGLHVTRAAEVLHGGDEALGPRVEGVLWLRAVGFLAPTLRLLVLFRGEPGRFAEDDEPCIWVSYCFHPGRRVPPRPDPEARLQVLRPRSPVPDGGPANGG